jgi:hypothetical protein
LQKEGKKRDVIVQFFINALTFAFSLRVEGLSYVLGRRIFLFSNIHPTFKYEYCKQQRVLAMASDQLCEATLASHKSTTKDPACIALDESWNHPRNGSLRVVIIIDTLTSKINEYYTCEDQK